MQGKTVAESESIMHHLPMPDETNPAGTIHGGFLLKHIDTVGGLAAMRHCRMPVVTASLERMDFLTPVLPGELITLKASVNLVGNSSMEVGVRVEVENIRSGAIRHAATCYLTYVALGKDGTPQTVPPLILMTDEERSRHCKAEQRRALRAQLREAHCLC